MRSRLLVAVAATALLAMAVVPAARAQAASDVQVGIKNPTTSTPTTLYFHMIDFQDFPINTQKPDDKYTQNVNVGVGTNSLTCLGDPPAGGHPFQEFHVRHGYSSPSYVEYNFEQDGKPRTHPERGISYDATLDGSAPFWVYWYLVTMPQAGTPTSPGNTQAAPSAIPNIVMKATIRAGDAISVDDKAYDSGPELVMGQTNPVTLAGGHVVNPTTGALDQDPYVTAVQAGQPGTQATIYQFKIPMKVDSPTIPRATGYNIRVETFIDNPYCTGAGTSDGSKELMPNMVQDHSSAQFRPRMELAVMNPIRLEYLHPQFVGDDLVVHTSMNSVWGNYDVGEVSPYTPDVTSDYISVGITGPSPATSLAQAAIVQRTHEHYHHQEAVDVTYVWPYKTDRAQNGLYTVDVKFKNDQGTAMAEGVAQFEIGKGTVIGCGGVQESAKAISNDCAAQVQKDGQTAKKKSPGVELLGVLGVLGAAIAVARRHQRK
jgi:hypothetical protein